MHTLSQHFPLLVLSLTHARAYTHTHMYLSDTHTRKHTHTHTHTHTMGGTLPNTVMNPPPHNCAFTSWGRVAKHSGALVVGARHRGANLSLLVIMCLP